MFFVCGFIFTFQAQDAGNLTKSAHQKLTMMQLGILFPTDSNSKFKIVKYNNRSYAKEDFRIALDDQEVLIFLYPEKLMKMDFPHLEFNRLITHLASNAPEDHIFVYNVPIEPPYDWASEARFKIKNRVSDKDYATAQGFYREGRGLYIALYLNKDLETEFTEVLEFIENSN